MANVGQLCEITQCSLAVAETLLEATNNNLSRAVELVFEKKMEGSNTSGAQVIEKDGELIDLTDQQDLKSENNNYVKFDVVNSMEESEEDLMSKAMEASLAEYKLQEPSMDQTYHSLSTNFPEIHPSALCQKFEGRSVELEMFLQDNIQELPTRVGAERRKLEEQLGEIVRAGLEGAEQMKVESCPRCDHPRILEDATVKVFSCLSQSCRGDFCRRCGQVQHFPQECKVAGTAKQLFDPSKDFEVISVQPKRTFDQSDPLDMEFRTAESQFLRLQTNVGGKFVIKSVDIVNNKRLRDKFEAKQKELEELGCGEVLLVFHGTPQENIEPILRNNFDLSKRSNGRQFGDGVYFSECPEVSLGYSKDNQSLLLCKVLRGTNSREVIGVVNKDDKRCWAIVVPNVDQVLPCYVINFSDKK